MNSLRESFVDKLVYTVENNSNINGGFHICKLRLYFKYENTVRYASEFFNMVL